MNRVGRPQSLADARFAPWLRPARSFKELRPEECNEEVDEDAESGRAAQPVDPVHERPPLPISFAQNRINPADNAKKPTISATKTKSIAFSFLLRSDRRRFKR
jgi:hypothetical protein